MRIEHRGAAPVVHASAYVAPTATLIGDVTVGAGSRVLHGAVVTAEDGTVGIGENVVIMENALLRGRAAHPVVVGDNVMVGPHVHVNGARVGNNAFIATGAALFPGSTIGAGAEVRIHAVVHVNTAVAPGCVVPIGWIAVGRDARVLAPDKHDEIWEIQRQLDFVGTVYGADPDATMKDIMRGQSAFFQEHESDVVLDSSPEVSGP
jgi:carbonic anhydrase/acetyltransferase-like protein (isoleucine patch superfamily)